ncbi:MAG: glycoside hydrolase family 9 protein, partial [Bacteroidales bacterium]
FAHLRKEDKWLKKADYWGELEPITPWMETGKARHYQWYPFVNLGHFYLATSQDENVRKKYVEYMREGLEHIRKRGENDPFFNGVPYLWCSANFTAGAITQARLYHQATGDSTYLDMEAALRDWLFGCNPWGTSLICGLPEGGDYPELPHSGYTKTDGKTTHGGLVDGPVYQRIFNNLRGLVLYRPDMYKEFQNGIAVYHDDLGDYSTNEPTMDGTASLSFYLSAMEAMGSAEKKVVTDTHQTVIRMNPDKKTVYLTFTGDSLFGGIDRVLKSLHKAKVKGSFFLTGNCIRLHEEKVREIVR